MSCDSAVASFWLMTGVCVILMIAFALFAGGRK